MGSVLCPAGAARAAAATGLAATATGLAATAAGRPATAAVRPATHEARRNLACWTGQGAMLRSLLVISYTTTPLIAA